MPPKIFPAKVLLAGPDGAALEAVRPAAEMLEMFGLRAETVVIAGNGFDLTRLEGACAVIVGSPDGLLPAAVASVTDLPVIRVPTETAGRSGLALLNDIDCKLPAATGNDVFATMAIGVAGAKNAALFVVAALAVRDERLRTAYAEYRARQTEAVLEHPALEP